MLPSKDTMDFIISGFGMNTAMISKFDAVGVFMTLDGFEQLYGKLLREMNRRTRISSIMSGSGKIAISENPFRI